MKMMYIKNDSMTIQYTLKTDPPEAMNWTTHRLKKTEIKLITKVDKSIATSIRQEIFDDIISREPNNLKKSAPAKDAVQERSQRAQPRHVKTRQTKQKTRRRSNS